MNYAVHHEWQALTQEQQPEADHGGVTCDDNVSNIILASIFLNQTNEHALRPFRYFYYIFQTLI